MVATVVDGMGHVERKASSAELRQFEESANAELGNLAVEVLDISYGSSPPGLHQVLPEGLPAPALEPGRRYVVFAAGPFQMGISDFTA